MNSYGIEFYELNPEKKYEQINVEYIEAPTAADAITIANVNFGIQPDGSRRVKRIWCSMEHVR